MCWYGPHPSFHCSTVNSLWPSTLSRALAQADGKKVTSEDLLAQIKASLSGLIAGQTQGRRPTTGRGPEDDRTAYLYSLLGVTAPLLSNLVHASMQLSQHRLCRHKGEGLQSDDP